MCSNPLWGGLVKNGLIQLWSRTGLIFGKYSNPLWGSLASRTHSTLVTHRLLKYLLSLKPYKFSYFNIFLRLTDDSFRCPCVHNIYNTFPLLYLTFMICILIYFVCLDILILLTFLIFCLSEFIDNCKSPVDTISEDNLSVYNNKVSSQYSPDRKSPSFRTHACDDLCWSAGRQQSQNWIRRLVLSFGIVSGLE